MDVIYIDSFTEFPAAAGSTLAWNLVSKPQSGDWAGLGTAIEPLALTIDTSSGMSTAIGNEGPHNISGLRGAPLGLVNSVDFTGAISTINDPGYGDGQQNYVDLASWQGEGSPTNSFWFEVSITGGTPSAKGSYTVTATCTELSDDTSTWTIADASSPPMSPGHPSDGGIDYVGWLIDGGGVGSASISGAFVANTNFKVGSFTSPANIGGTSYQADIKIPDIVHVHPDNTNVCSRVSLFLVVLTVTDSLNDTAEFHIRLTLVHSD